MTLLFTLAREEEGDDALEAALAALVAALSMVGCCLCVCVCVGGCSEMGGEERKRAARQSPHPDAVEQRAPRSDQRPRQCQRMSALATVPHATRWRGEPVHGEVQWKQEEEEEDLEDGDAEGCLLKRGAV